MKLINDEKLILASKSPRRKELLEQIGLSIKIIPSDIDEKRVRLKEPEEFVRELSFLKAESIAGLYPDSWILGADTIVVVQDRILGKPQSENDAVRMLSSLNNRTHSVYTAFCIINHKKETIIKQSIETRVNFKRLSDREINWYVGTKEPFDKAGAYAIQGIGAFLVKQISGSYSNVVGLPVCEVVETLMNLKIIQI